MEETELKLKLMTYITILFHMKIEQCTSDQFSKILTLVRIYVNLYVLIKQNR